MIILVSILILLCFTVLLFLPVKLSIRYSDKLSFKVYIAGFPVSPNKLLRKKKGEKKILEKDSPAETNEQRFSRYTESLSEKASSFSDTFTSVTKLTQKFLNVEKFSVNITVGTGGAPSTAISTGLLWATVYNVIGILGSVVYIDNPSVEIAPDYGQCIFKSYVRCIISTRIVYIILIGTTILFKKLSRKGKEE